MKPINISTEGQAPAGILGVETDARRLAMISYQYVRDHYGVPAETGRRVVINGKPGVIAEDRGHHIGVLFDADKPGVISLCHPTWRVEYLGLGKVRRMTRSQHRYQRYLEFGDSFDSFIEFCRWDDACRRVGGAS